MDIDGCKINSVILDGGTGVLYQAASGDEFSYILTARHNFYDKTEKTIKDSIKISFSNSQTEIIEIPFKLGQNYFEHRNQNVDAAILKIEFRPGIYDIGIDFDCHAFEECILCGFPGNLRANKDDKYTTYTISRKIDTTQNGYFRIQSDFGTLTYEDFLGFSGGGIFRSMETGINLIGIQSKSVTNYANGQVDIIPISFYNEIAIENGLPDLRPWYLKDFRFLKEKVFNISAGMDDEDIAYTRHFLKQKAAEVIASDITPSYIKDYFSLRLLVNDNDSSKLNDELIYITWLEFLTLVNIVKEKSCNVGDLENVFSYLRLLYKKTEADWLDTDFLKDCMVSNYDGLSEDGTVFIKTSKLPLKQKLEHYRLSKGSIIPRIDSLKRDFNNGNLNSDVVNITNALSGLKEFVFEKFNFVHFEYLKNFMLVENSSDYKGFNRLNEQDLIKKLKDEYGKVFSIR